MLSGARPCCPGLRPDRRAAGKRPGESGPVRQAGPPAAGSLCGCFRLRETHSVQVGRRPPREHVHRAHPRVIIPDCTPFPMNNCHPSCFCPALHSPGSRPGGCLPRARIALTVRALLRAAELGCFLCPRGSLPGQVSP